jgi:hypothetical protein
MNISRNMGDNERLARGIVGALLIGFSIVGVIPGVFGVVAFIAGLVLAITGVLRYCPVTAALGINTAEE